MFKSMWVKLLVVVMMVSFVGFGCAKKQVESAPKQEVAKVEPKAAAPAKVEPAPVVDDTAEKLAKAATELAALTVFFDFDKSELKDATRANLEKVGAMMQGFAALKVTIEGHCDERGTAEYNMALGDRRANAAKEFLVKLGVDAARLNTVSFGKEQPADAGHNEAAWSKNRRDEFKVWK